MPTIRTRCYARITRNGWGIGFGPNPTHCYLCRAALPAPVQTGAPGYATIRPRPAKPPRFAPALRLGEVVELSRAICYGCASGRERRAMIRRGRATLYLTRQPIRDLPGSGPQWVVTDWPGRMEFRATVATGAHNMARVRYDAWFTGPDGRQWHGVRYGNNTQIIRCRRLAA